MTGKKCKFDFPRVQESLAQILEQNLDLTDFFAFFWNRGIASKFYSVYNSERKQESYVFRRRYGGKRRFPKIINI